MASASPDDEQLARSQLKMREMERKATFESTQNELRRQKDSLQHLRRENKELLSALNQTAKGTTLSGDAFDRKELELLSTKIHTQRRNLDMVKEGNDEKEAEINGFAAKLDDLSREAQPILSDESPLTQKIRTLENRLDKALIKHNEAMAIRRTYEQIVKRLRDERVGFDNQLAAIEKTLKAKEHDYLELSNMAHDAHHAKEIAKAEVVQFKAAYAEERRQKKKELDERKAYVQSRIDQAAKQEKANKQKKQQDEQQQQQKQEDEEKRRRDVMHSTVELRTEEEHERLQQYADAYRRIKDVTRASNVDEVIDKFIAQEHTHSTLSDMTRDIQEKIKSLHTQRSEIRRKLEDTKYSGSGQLGSRRIVDEFQTHLDEAKAQLEKASQTYERVSKQYIAAEAGVEHLAEKLGLSRNVSDGTVATLLQQCGKELQARYGDTQRILEQGDSILYSVDMEPPQNNVRVKLLSEHEEEEEDRKGDGKEVEDAEDDPHDRAALKAMSESAVDRETKKAKKRNRKANEEA